MTTLPPPPRRHTTPADCRAIAAVARDPKNAAAMRKLADAAESYDVQGDETDERAPTVGWAAHLGDMAAIVVIFVVTILALMVL